MKHSSIHDLWGIMLSFPRLSPTLGQIVRVLLSSMPRAEPSRLACLKRIPIAVIAGRINRNLQLKLPSYPDTQKAYTKYLVELVLASSLNLN